MTLIDDFYCMLENCELFSKLMNLCLIGDYQRVYKTAWWWYSKPIFWSKRYLRKKLFNNLSFCAGLVLQPASEAEEDEVCGSRQHPLASALLPHKKSKFSILRTAFRGRPGETFEDIWYRKEVEFCLIKNRSKQVTSINALSMQEISEKGNTLVENKITKDLETRRATLRRQYCWTEFPFVVAIGNC